MQTILPPSGNTSKILGKPKLAEHGLRWMTYVLAQPVDGGVLVFHTLTRALLLLTQQLRRVSEQAGGTLALALALPLAVLMLGCMRRFRRRAMCAAHGPNRCGQRLTRWWTS